MSEGQKIFDFIKTKLESKMVIIVATRLRATQFNPKHLKDLNEYFKVLNGELFMRRGKAWDCIATQNNCFVSVQSYRKESIL
jgi:hypothetical protein